MNVSTPTQHAETKTATWWQRHGQRLRLIVRIAAFIAVLVGVLWWQWFASVSVTSHTVVSRTVAAEVMGTGTLEARTSAIVGPKIGGLIVHVAADQGDRVAGGALLFQLEDADIEQQVGIAKSDIAAVNATLDRLRAAQRGAQAVLAQATTSHERIVALASSNAASKRDLDKASEALSVAQAESSVAAAAVVEGRKRLEAAKRSLEYQRVRLHDTTIEAPFDGLIVRRNRDVGDVVASAASVFEIVSTKEMWISAWVDETALARLHEGEPARVEFRSQPGAEFPGEVVRVGREVDRETRELLVDVRVDQLPEVWAIGQRAEVYIRVDQRNGATALPAEFVLVRDGQTGVMLDDAGRARWRDITVGLRGRDVVAVIQGLSAGDVVLSPADVRGEPLREGRRITAQ